MHIKAIHRIWPPTQCAPRRNTNVHCRWMAHIQVGSKGPCAARTIHKVERGRGRVYKGYENTSRWERSVIVYSKSAIRESGSVTVALSAVIVVILGVVNRVSNKVALVALKDFILVLVIIQTFTYIAIYFSILGLRLKRGIISKEMLTIPKRRFVIIGLLEAFGLAASLQAAADIPGALLPVLSQSYIAFSLLFSRLILGKKYRFVQIIGCIMTIAGVLLSLKPYMADSLSLVASKSLTLKYNALLYTFSYALFAVAVILKEDLLQNSRGYGPAGVDVFVINSFCSLYQGITSLFMIFFFLSAIGMGLLNVRTTPLEYLGDGMKCIAEMWLPPVIYIFCNVLFNVQMLSLVKKSSALLAGLSITLVVPLSFLAFSLPIPIIGRAEFYVESLTGLCVLVCGIILFNLNSVKKIKSH